jgi:hypothetical protein
MRPLLREKMRFAYLEMGVRHTCRSPSHSNRHWSPKRHSKVAVATNVEVVRADRHDISPAELINVLIMRLAIRC